jgi:AraC family transcriptional regulator
MVTGTTDQGVSLPVQRKLLGTVDERSLSAQRNQPGLRLASSTEVGWQSLLVEKFATPSKVEQWDSLATPDHSVVLMVKGQCSIESFKGGIWRRGHYHVGAGGMTAGLNTNRLRWLSSEVAPHETLHIYIPEPFFELAIEHVWDRSTSRQPSRPDTLVFSDPVIFRVCVGLMEAAERGAPELYAESAAQFLASHLLVSKRLAQLSIGQYRGNAEAISDQRLERVLDYMQNHYLEPLSLNELSREAGISRFHFITVFRKKFGSTPHQYLIQLRMAAAAMLKNENRTIAHVAQACGYRSPVQFCAAFRRHYSQNPRAYRLSITGAASS